MARIALLLRGINVGGHKRIAMADLRGWLEDAGFEDVTTLLQSGNVVLTGTGGASAIADRAAAAIEQGCGHRVGIVPRTKAQLAALATADPLGDVADNGSLRFVSFLESKLPAATRTKLAAIEPANGSALEVRDRELVLWCPHGSRDDRLVKDVARACGTRLLRTDRNWNTVGKLLAALDAD